MPNPLLQHFSIQPNRLLAASLAITLGTMGLFVTPLSASAQDASMGPGGMTANTGSGAAASMDGGSMNANTGIANGIIGNGSMSADNTGVAINGGGNENVNNAQNTTSVTTGSNANANSNKNQNVFQPVLYSPTQTTSGGGNSLLVMPRNSIGLGNAMLGRKNLGLRWGVHNNPGLAAITGKSNAMSWYFEGGLNVPFGKIPEPYQASKNARVDDLRQRKMRANRNVFGGVGKKQVQGSVVGLSAFNYGTTQASKIGSSAKDSAALNASLISSLSTLSQAKKLPQPKVLALDTASVFTHPLDKGKKIGKIKIGHEYPYLGHTKSGWVKVLLTNGQEGWTQTDFEYIKFDYTQVDNLASGLNLNTETASALSK